MSKLHERKNRHDAFHQRAKKEGFAARAVYKLAEIDEKYRVFRPGAAVLDLGCRPGSWLQYARKQVGDKAVLVGVDRGPLEVTVPGAVVIVGDVFTISLDQLRAESPRYAVVLSDMAPDTTGVRSVDQARSEGLFERALEVAEALLEPGGNFVGKLFQGPDWQKLIKRCRASFDKVATVKPKSSREESIEQYVVALSRKRSA